MALCWSGTFIAGRLLGGHVHPLHTALLRYLGALALIFCWLLWTRKPYRYGLRQHIGFLLQGLTGIVLYNILFFSALEISSASRTALVVTSNPAVIAIFSVFLFQEESNWLKWLGVAINMLGVMTIVSNGRYLSIFSDGASFGDLLSLLCMLSWAAYTLIGKRVLRKTLSLHAVFYSTLYGAIILAVATLFHDGGNALLSYTPDAYLAIAYLAFFGTTLPFVWFNEGIVELGALRTSGFINLVPIFAVMLAYLLLGETLSWSSLVGGGMVVVGLFLVNGLYKVFRKRST